jgi:peptidoglycan-associated lipoprotein
MKKVFMMAIVGVAAIVALSGCGCFQQKMRGETAPPLPVASESKAVPSPEAKAPAPVASPAPQQEKPVAGAAPVAAVVVLEDIRFDFDKYTIRPGDAEILKKNYEWFKTHDGTRVRIEGNCDERGTIEYNLVLGQKRADSAKKYLVELGVAAGNLDTISYGKERPIDPGHNEEAWAKNRRDHFEPIK